MKLKAVYNDFWGCWTLVQGNGHLFIMAAQQGHNATVAGYFKDIATAWNQSQN